MMELATHPPFTAAHPFEAAANPVMFSFPTSPRLMLFLGPRVRVRLLLALAAAVAHLGLLGPG